MNIGEQVKKFREANRLSLRKFADRAGVKTATVAKIEKGHEHIQAETKDKLLKAMNIQPEPRKLSTSKKTKFEVVKLEPWMEFKMQKVVAPIVIDLVEFLRSQPVKTPVKMTLEQLGYLNIQTARNSLRVIGRRYNMELKIAEKAGELFIFKKEVEKP